MSTGAQLRFARLCRAPHGRSLIYAMDHGLLLGSFDGLDDPLGLLERLIGFDPDGIVLSPGVMRLGGHLFGHRSAPAAIVRLDAVPLDQRLIGTVDTHRLICDPAEAAALGADAVIAFVVANADGDLLVDNISRVAEAAAKARRIGLPMIVEVIPWSRHNKLDEPTSHDLVAAVCRMVAETGVDAIKTVHPENPEAIEELVRSVSVPLFVLGGSPSEDGPDTMDLARSAIAAGATGLIYGRQVWQHDDPAVIAQQLNEIVHSS